MSYFSFSNTIPSHSTTLTEDLFRQLRTFIYERTGIFFADNKKYLLESRVNRRLSALAIGSFEEYYRALMNGSGSTELALLINSITINETFFFRNEPQFAAIESHVLPQIIMRRRQDGINRIRLWSAAASSGEEPYTLALIIKEKFQPRFPAIKFEIVGTDINTQVLDVAKRGIYKEYSVRNIPAEYMHKYFKHDGDKYFLSEDVKKLVEYRQLNLFDKASMRLMRDFDVVIAANVLIYFDYNSKESVVSSVYNSLNKGGYFFVGYSETLYGVSQALKPVHFEKAIAYRKE